MEKKTVLVAMSGGVDSSVAAALLVEQGYNVIGATMKTFCYSESESEANGPSKTCCGLDGILDAKRVADRLGIPHYVFDVEKEFTRDVIDDFVSEYAAGRTPNPCVRCNGNTKFRDLLKRGRMLGCDFIATGHYARMGTDEDGNPLLLRGQDEKKDQSYFLWALPPELLPLLLFPVGELTKPEVREKARELGLSTAEKPESMEICFVPTGNYADFLSRKLGSEHASLTPGKLVTSSGEVLGEHDGYARYTVGQRKGLGGGRSLPLYVIGTRPATREVVVGTADELVREDVRIDDLNWLAVPPAAGDAIRVQVRHRASAVPARVVSVEDGTVNLVLDQPQRAITPGQSAVMFSGDVVLGGGRIAA
ncbi:tRNA 2-thiouridine(34) synthase MnmA [Longimicrobium sp.]|jgi:tRNA-specific 2-thiouridylase|uniref:tRNA 2-thiouridine(34) synthase MnmA n=1 Tax=Longimicrobium sp. TaxID=2029185 RepID=UPI002F95FBEF